MDLNSQYLEKRKTPAEVLASIQDGDYIFSAQSSSAPVTLIEEMPLLRQWGRKNLVFNSCGPNYDHAWFHDPAMRDTVEHVSWFFSPPVRKACQEGLCGFLPGDTTSLVRKTMDRARWEGRRPVLLATAAPLDAQGNFTLSVSALFERDLINAGALVLLEVSSKHPRICGDTLIPLSRVTAFTETDRPVPAGNPGKAKPVDQKIAARVAELIPDGSTLQLGVGHLPNAVAVELRNRKHLGIHSGVFGYAMLELIRSGAVDNSQKGFMDGFSICSSVSGGQDLFDFVDDNHSVLFRAGTFTNNPRIIAKNRNMVSLNSTLEIDLTGQSAGESMGFRQFSASGAQPETIQGAQFSPGGKSILALPSAYEAKTADGKRVLQSKIVTSFRPGTVVTSSRTLVDYVVTEYGTACLRGLSIPRRVEALIAIAHPEFREQLRQDAKKYGLLY